MGEVGDVSAQLTLIQRGNNRIGIYDLVAGEVEQAGVYFEIR